ncbi:peptidyl-tRNA hydrolase PTH2-domain-containing protein [Lentinula detonsa]|uniref:peptidyl-tRNA hydrolase n=1 Tax=Lentinula detonsa TaxID=2804962 RepID=A0AA38QB34_9AGAR|nr:peptidyl-tRNA hydrolase PTH2-domain-containing protein [Lentinula detonsa]
MPTSSEDVDISGLDVGPLDECKMVLVVRTDLNMSTGKIAAQCSHATLACYKTLLSSNPAFLRQWERTGQTKIALKCYSEEELLTLQAQAQSLNLCARSIQDAGRTQIAAGSRTVLGIAGKCIWICYFLYMQSLSFHTRVGQIGEQDYWNTATALNLS